MLKILETRIATCGNDKVSSGEIVAIEPNIGIIVKTADGWLAIRRLQLEGAKAMEFEEFLRGHRARIGDRLGK